jgi:hypothetical protein
MCRVPGSSRICNGPLTARNSPSWNFKPSQRLLA